MKRRTIFAAIMLLFLVTTLLCGCGGSKEKNPDPIGDPEPVGNDAAMDAAFGDLGISMTDADNIKIKYNSDKGVYEISFTHKSEDYIYQIDSLTAQVKDKSSSPSSNPQSEGDLTDSAALDIMFADAGASGVTVADMKDIKVKKTTENGEKVWLCSYSFDGKTTSYTISAVNGNILKKVTE